MAESFNNLKDFAPQSSETGTLTDIPVSAATTILTTLAVPIGMRWLFIEVKNSHAGVDFDAFALLRRVHADGSFSTFANSAGDFSTPVSPLLDADGAPVTLGASNSAFIRMRVEGTESIRITASGNGAASLAELYYRFGQ